MGKLSSSTALPIRCAFRFDEMMDMMMVMLMLLQQVRMLWLKIPAGGDRSLVVRWGLLPRH